MTLSAEEVGTVLGVSSAVATRLHGVAAALVNEYQGSETPDAVSNEAVLRVSGWLHDRGPGGPAPVGQVRAEVEEVEVQYAPGLGALRMSGARALLDPWAVRTAGLF